MDWPFSHWLVVAVGYLLALLTSLRVVMQRREPTATLAWVLGVVLLPYIGVIAYLVFGRRRLERQVRRRRARATMIERDLERGSVTTAPAPPPPVTAFPSCSRPTRTCSAA